MGVREQKDAGGGVTTARTRCLMPPPVRLTRSHQPLFQTPARFFLPFRLESRWIALPGWPDAKRYWQSSSQVCGLTAYRPQRTEGVSDQSDAGRQSVTQYEARKVKFVLFFFFPPRKGAR